MRIAIDLETLELRTWAGAAITELSAKRRDRFAVEVKFVRGGVFTELSSGATGLLGVKALSSFTAAFLASATSWVKTGTGVSAIYTFDLNLNTSAVATAFTADPNSVAAALEFEWVIGDFRYSSVAMPLNVFNDYIRGDEGVPVEGDPAYPQPADIMLKSVYDANDDGVPDGMSAPVVSSGAISALTSPQQATIVEGTVVTTTDGRRWVYSGTGTKTLEASYVELADITPAWASIPGKPSTFAPSTHKTSHATGGADELVPSDIGAEVAGATKTLSQITDMVPDARVRATKTNGEVAALLGGMIQVTTSTDWTALPSNSVVYWLSNDPQTLAVNDTSKILTLLNFGSADVEIEGSSGINLLVSPGEFCYFTFDGNGAPVALEQAVFVRGANSTRSGLVSTGTQQFAGAKEFLSPLTVAAATSGGHAMNRNTADARYATGLLAPVDIAARYQVMVPQAVATTAPGTATLLEQYGWGADISTGVGSNGRCAVNLGNPSPGLAVNYGTRTVELVYQLNISGLDANANLWVQFGGSGTNIQPLVNTNRGFAIRTNGASSSQVVCVVANGTTLTESSPITIPGANLLLPMQYRLLSTPGGNVVFYARSMGETAWTTLWSTALGPTATTSDTYQCLAAVAKATGTTTTAVRAWIRAVRFGIY